MHSHPPGSVWFAVGIVLLVLFAPHAWLVLRLPRLFLETRSFQALPFYERLGCQVRSVPELFPPVGAVCVDEDAVGRGHAATRSIRGGLEIAKQLRHRRVECVAAGLPVLE